MLCTPLPTPSTACTRLSAPGTQACAQQWSPLMVGHCCSIFEPCASMVSGSQSPCVRGSLLGWSSQDLGHPRMERMGEQKGTAGAPGPESWRLEPSSGDQFLTLLVPQASAPPAPGCKVQVLKNLFVTLFAWTSQRVTHSSSPHCESLESSGLSGHCPHCGQASHSTSQASKCLPSQALCRLSTKYGSVSP